MTAMIRRTRLLVLSLWIGVGVGVAFVSTPAVFAIGRQILGPSDPGRVAQAILLRYFQVQLGFAGLFGLLGLLDALQSRVRQSAFQRWTTPLMLAASLGALFWLHPKMASMNEERHSPTTTATRRAEISSEFARLHGMGQGANLLLMLMVLVHWHRVLGAIERRAAGVEKTGR